jgi:hypothetical protein
MGLRRGSSQRRTTIRAISLFIILGTIPFYIILTGLWLFSPQSGRSDDGPTFTPQGNLDGGSGDEGDGFATFTPQGLDRLTPTEFIASATPNLGGTFTYFTPDGGVFTTPTIPPTRYMSPTPAPTLAPTNTLPPSNTPAVAPTDVIVPTQPPLIPPTDTPSV